MGTILARMKRRFGWLVIALTLFGCERTAPTPQPPSSTSALAVIEPAPSLAALNRGARLFQEQCAQCHGPEAQGHPDWQTPGVIAAPPLNGTGNDWKRSWAELTAVIKDGAKRDGNIVMPGWKDRLSDTEISDLIAWFQTLWPPEVYAKWRQSATIAAEKAAR